MSHVGTVDVRQLGDGDLEVIVTETGCGAADEVTITHVAIPQKFRLLRMVSVCSVTVDPILGRVTNPTGTDVLAENDTAATTVDNVPIVPIPCRTFLNTDGKGVLYHRSRPSSGSDNSVSTMYLLRTGWVD